MYVSVATNTRPLPRSFCSSNFRCCCFCPRICCFATRHPQKDYVPWVRIWASGSLGPLWHHRRMPTEWRKALRQVQRAFLHCAGIEDDRNSILISLAAKSRGTNPPGRSPEIQRSNVGRRTHLEEVLESSERKVNGVSRCCSTFT